MSNYVFYGQPSSADPSTKTVSDANPLPAGDGGPNWTDSIGVSGQGGQNSSDASSTPLVITDAPTSGQKIVLTDLEISVDTQMTLTLRTTSDHKVIGKWILAANTVYVFCTRGKRKAPTANETLELLASTSGNIYATAIYHSE